MELILQLRLLPDNPSSRPIDSFTRRCWKIDILREDPVEFKSNTAALKVWCDIVNGHPSMGRDTEWVNGQWMIGGYTHLWRIYLQTEYHCSCNTCTCQNNPVDRLHSILSHYTEEDYRKSASSCLSHRLWHFASSSWKRQALQWDHAAEQVVERGKEGSADGVLIFSEHLSIRSTPHPLKKTD